jgi:hypothetical protein
MTRSINPEMRLCPKSDTILSYSWEGDEVSFQEFRKLGDA